MKRLFTFLLVLCVLSVSILSAKAGETAQQSICIDISPDTEIEQMTFEQKIVVMKLITKNINKSTRQLSNCPPDEECEPEDDGGGETQCYPQGTMGAYVCCQQIGAGGQYVCWTVWWG